MWIFKSKRSGNYVKDRNHMVTASYLFSTDINQALLFESVPQALEWLQIAVMKNTNDCWVRDNNMPLRAQCINGILTLCEVEQYTPPKYTQWREKRVI